MNFNDYILMELIEMQYVTIKMLNAKTEDEQRQIMEHAKTVRNRVGAIYEEKEEFETKQEKEKIEEKPKKKSLKDRFMRLES